MVISTEGSMERNLELPTTTLLICMLGKECLYGERCLV